MAQTDFGALTALQKKVWSARVWSAGRDESFFLGQPGFMGSGLSDSGKPIHLVDDLTADGRGTRCVMPLVQDMQGDGVAGDEELEGKEEALVADSVEIQIDQFRNGLKSKGRLSEQTTVIRFRAHARDKLGYWLGSKLDEMAFLVASGTAFSKKLDLSTRPTASAFNRLTFAADVTAPSTNRVAYGDGTSTATLTTGGKMTWALLVSLKAKAIRRRIKPIRMKGGNHYIVVMGPEQARDLKGDTDYKTTLQQAGVRGSSNELFTGAFAMVDGLILYEHAKVVNTFGLVSGSTKWGASNTVDGSIALMMGAQALGFARIGEAYWSEGDLKDHGNKETLGYGQMIGWKKPKFNSIYDGNASEDFSIIAVYTASAQ